ncbi:MAG: succinyldiaminopimelate transaminase [Gammaproteobacteria bacterium]|nr:succinyldiaminopimelate transaminase [Gammaproteobacteria bacterium]
MNSDLDRLQPYPFERLATLKAGIEPRRRDAITLAIGEPKHPHPDFVGRAIQGHLDGLERYPTTRGTTELREAIASWLCRRFKLPNDAVGGERHVLPVNGTREALFAFAQCVVDRRHDPVVIMPNPFYQIYEGACLLAGAEPWYLNTTAETGWLPDFTAVPERIWRRTQLVYICSPSNPTGKVIAIPQLQQLIELAERYDFVIASDECYSEIYQDEDAPPCGLLEASAGMGNNEFRRCMVFHSLSKRSNLPGMRSGFVAGDADLIAQFLRYRTYHGCSMSPYHQLASLEAWKDEGHVRENRVHYREKFAAVAEVLNGALRFEVPPASFYLWPQTPISDTEFARGLFAEQNVTVLPGSYLSRNAHGANPGADHVRIALVAPLDECVAAARRIREFVDGL